MSETIKVMVADDEYYARKAMIKKLKKTGLPLEIVADFENGSQMVDYLTKNEQTADMILTDVRMPEMDGLQVAEWVSGQELPIDIIIVSGFTEFEYAKRAIQFGVREYLIKPVEEEELKAAVWKIINKRRKEESETGNLIKRQLLSQAVAYLSFDELIKNQSLKEQVFDFLLQSDRQYQLIIIQPEQGISKDCRYTLEQILDQEWIQESGGGIHLHNYNEYIFFLFPNNELSVEPRLFKWMKEIKDKLPDTIVFMGISTLHQGMQSLKKAYQEAVYAMNQRLTKTGQRIFLFRGEIKPENLLTKEREMLIARALEENNLPEAQKCISHMLDSAENSYTLYVTVIGIFSLFYQVYSRGQKEETSEQYMLFTFRSDLYGFYSLEELKFYLFQMMQCICKGSENEPEHHYIIAGVLDYIEKNYAYNISLNELAEHKYFVNVSYLSRLFKQEMGQPFSKYLISFRMEKAAAMLESRVLKINDIAALCGYNDVSRFIQYFKKQYGYTPEEYRRSCEL